MTSCWRSLLPWEMLPMLGVVRAASGAKDEEVIVRLICQLSERCKTRVYWIRACEILLRRVVTKAVSEGAAKKPSSP